MKFEWDETKDRRNFNKHGVNFNDATEIFSSIRVTTVDDRKANARERRKYDEFIEGTANEEARRDQR
ncbi:MAG: hypothetical protein HN368_07835 [Spirochaetales bacterium]|nr:hypothetical protein [Spirochaetales bacterium]